MPDGEINYITKNCDTSDEITQMEQHNGMRSFVVTVNDNGKIEVNPKNQEEFCQQSNCNHKAKKRLGKGKQRIRIALIEEDATGSSDVEQDENGSIVSIDAQSFDAMHDRFVKIYNKNVRGKPSFVVLEDALMRKRIEDTLQKHFDSTTCHHHQQQHCHAQQQTSPCDIGAHTGSQTDEFLLQCAMRSRLPGHSRGCQATDHTYNKVELSHNASSSSSRKHLQVPSLRRLNQLRSLPFNNSTLSSATLAAPVVSAPHVTITVSPPSTANMPVIMQAQQQPLQQQQIQQQQQLLLPAATHSYCNCFSNLQPCISNSCNNCCLPQPVKSNYCLPATNTCFLQPQQQQHQQQYPAMTTTYGNCTSNCCLLGPTLAQTTLGYGPTMSEQCSHNILETLSPQQCQDCPAANWPTQICNHCQYYPMSNCNMADFGRVHYASCPMQQQAPQQQPQQQQALQQGPQQQQAPQQQQVPQQQRAQQQQPAPQQQPVPHQQLLQQQRLQQQPDQLLQIQTQHQQSQQQQRKKQLENKSASQNPSEQLSKKLVEETLAASAAKLDKIAKKVRYKLSGTAASNKLYMARFGRTCLILKPNMCSMPPRLLTKPISRCTSVSALPQKNIEK